MNPIRCTRSHNSSTIHAFWAFSWLRIAARFPENGRMTEMTGRTTRLALVCGLGALAMTAPAQANINKRQERQQQRIANGVSSGQLTPAETARLEARQTRIARYEARSRADGPGLTAVERARLKRMQNGASKGIHHQKHDAQAR
jgi:hypothetical protein